MKKYFLLITFLFTISLSFAQDKEYDTKTKLTVVSYNVENLFDTFDDAVKKDEEFTPTGKKKWTNERFNEKINNISKVICSINENELPEIIGLYEIENDYVLKALIKKGCLAKGDYKFVHEESPDFRGIDVALLYRADEFKCLSHKKIPIIFPFSKITKTRDILYIKGIASDTDTLHIFLNHWSSRLGGQIKSEPKRVFIAKLLRLHVDSLLEINHNAKIIIMGDFNDEPTNISINNVLNANNKRKNTTYKDLYNLLYDKENIEGKGTLHYRKDWNMLDNLIVSQSLINSKEGYSLNYNSGKIFNPKWICYKDKSGNFVPNRSYGGSKYFGGYSDHFPVYFTLTKK
ncbi:MAG: endonuclease [Bacteroidales bacterium]|nr:endonuclease [Bacteroidales bacterium]